MARRVAVTGAMLACGMASMAAGPGGAVGADGTSGRHLKVWVLNLAGKVWPVDSVTHRAGTPFGLRGCGGFAFSLAITPDGRTVYVACAQRLFAINAATGRVGKAVGTGRGVADQVVVAPNGKKAYVASGNTVVPVTVSTGKAAKPIVVAKKGDGPAGLAVTPDSKTVYAVNRNTVVPVNTTTGRAERPIRTGSLSAGIVITPDGKTAYVLSGGNTVIPIRTKTNTAAKPIRIGPDTIEVNALAISPDGKTVYVAASDIVNPSINIVVPVSTTTNTARKPIKVGSFPDFITFTPDGKTAFVATAGAVYPIYTATGHVGRLIRTKFGPSAIVIAFDGATAWVTGFTLFHPHQRFSTGYLLPISTATDRPGKPIKLGEATRCLIMRPWQRGHAHGPSSCS